LSGYVRNTLHQNAWCRQHIAVALPACFTVPANMTAAAATTAAAAAAAAADLAVLKIPAAKDVLKPLQLGTSAGVRVGQLCLAIGSPFGFDRTLTTGAL
jgi:S1-C subfamily serine protease